MKKIASALLSLVVCLLCAVPALAFVSPLTGDSSHMGLWIAMICFALVAVVVVLIVMKKKK